MTTTSDLVRQVRSQLQETNTSPISDQMIIDALNRGKDYAVDILARFYPEPLLKPTDELTPDSDGLVDIPENTFEQRIKLVQYRYGNRWRNLRGLNVSEISRYEGSSSAWPVGYQTYQQKIRILPKPSPSVPIKLWYMEEQEDLVTVQGQITQVSVAENFIVVDSVGSLLDEQDTYYKYVNICDAQSGELKATMEIESVTGDKIILKSAPVLLNPRTNVLNKTILNEIPPTVQADDYISSIFGICVLPLRKPMSNFVLQFATTEIRRALGFDTTADEIALERFEKQVEKTWGNRENTGRIQMVNPVWIRTRRY